MMVHTSAVSERPQQSWGGYVLLGGSAGKRWSLENVGANLSPSAHAGVHPTAGSVVLHRLLVPLFATGWRRVVLLRAVLSSAVSTQARLLSFCVPRVANPADPQLLSGVYVAYHCSRLGACVADQEAAFSAVVSTPGWRELPEAAHAFVGGSVRDPGNSKGGAGLAAAAPQQAGTAVFDVINPGPLLLVGTGRHEKGLAWCSD